VIAEKVNHINDTVHTLEDELEHKISVDELSAYLEMPAEEIRGILRMAGDEIDVEGKNS
jgi:RNA polymerase primary sigma factor